MRRIARSTINDEQELGLVEQMMSQIYTRMLSPVQLTTGNGGAAAAAVDLFTAFPVAAAQMMTTRPGNPPYYMINGHMIQTIMMLIFQVFQYRLKNENQKG